MEEKERCILFLEGKLNTCQACGMGRLVSSNKHYHKPLKSPLVYLYKNGTIETLSQQN
jgi:hypothetical protein